MKTAREKQFLSEISEIRRRASEHISRGAVTPGYGGHVEHAIRILNEALATEIVCTLRYRSHYFLADGIQAESVKEEFLEHANEEQQHAEQISARIRQLGGVPNWNPDGILSRSHAEFQSRSKTSETPSQRGSLVDLLEEDLLAERIAIESYREMVQYFGDQDPTTRRLMEEVLAKEEEHAEDLQSFLMTLDPRKAG